MARLKLLTFRKQLGLTQKEMAERIGITSTHYSRIETGDANPSYELLDRFKEVFGVENVFEMFKCNN